MGSDDPYQPSVAERRLYALVVGVAMLFGGWWLQNQWNETQRLDGKINEFVRHVDSIYVDKEFLQVVTEEQTRRLQRIENKLDNIIENKHEHSRDGL